MSEKLMAYCLKLRENVEVENPRVEQAKNGVYFLRGNAKGSPGAQGLQDPSARTTQPALCPRSARPRGERRYRPQNAGRR